MWRAGSTWSTVARSITALREGLETSFIALKKKKLDYSNVLHDADTATYDKIRFVCVFLIYYCNKEEKKKNYLARIMQLGETHAHAHSEAYILY
jgi:hypothetical protein